MLYIDILKLYTSRNFTYTELKALIYLYAYIRMHESERGALLLRKYLDWLLWETNQAPGHSTEIENMTPIQRAEEEKKELNTVLGLSWSNVQICKWFAFP